MSDIPKSALLLGLSGLVPFLFAAALALMPEPTPPPGEFAWIYPSDAQAIFAAYGTIILCFMSGVLWGFAAQAPKDEAPTAYALSVLPAIYALFFCQPHLFSLSTSNLDTIRNLGIGFIALIALDWVFAQRAMAPLWWMKLRLLLTAIVVICLSIGFFA